MTEPGEQIKKRRTSLRRAQDRSLRTDLNRYNQLFQVGQIVTSEMDFDVLFEVIAEQTNHIMDTERCSVFLNDDLANQLKAFVSTDLKRNQIGIPKEAGIAGTVFTTRTPLIVNDAYNDPRFYPDIDHLTGFKTRSILCVPLVNRKNECIGTLQVLNKTSGAFNDEDREILTILSNYITIALENSMLYQEIKAMDKAKEKVIHHLAHELQTPLAVISSVFEVVKRKLAPIENESLLASIDRGQRNAKRLSRLQEKVDDILKSGLITGSVGDQNFSGFETLAVEPLIRDILQNEVPITGRRQLEIVTKIEPDIQLTFSTDLLRKVLLGLIKNAVENTPDEGRIEIGTRRDEGGIRIEVRDSGIGITPESRKHIFKGFIPACDPKVYASKQPFVFNAGGFGLDLLHIKLLAQKYDFSIGFESRRCGHIPRDSDLCPGKISDCRFVHHREGCLSSGGSRFWIRFPQEA